MNKKLKSVALLSAVVLSCVPAAAFAHGSSYRKSAQAADLTSSSLKVLIADDLPTKPRSKVRRLFVGGVQTTFGAFVGFAVANKLSRNVAAHKFGFGTGLVMGLMGAYDYWTSRSPAGCLRAFNRAYNNFLVSPLLKTDMSDVEFAQQWVFSHFGHSRWVLVDARQALANLQVNLNKAIDLGCVLRKASTDTETVETLTRKIDVMKTYLTLVLMRIRSLEMHPEYALQGQYKRAIERMKKDVAAEAESLRLRNELVMLREQQNYAYAQQLQQPQVYPATFVYPTAPAYVPVQPQTYARHCALCRGNLVGNKGYKTDCACLAGNYTYHHDCLKTKLAESNTCPQCHFANPKVLSDFGDGFTPAPVSQPTAPVVPTAPPVQPVQNAAYTCALCSGDIQPTARYRTDCNCTAGKYYYHHLCVTDTLKSNGNHCPKCNKANTTVKSAF